MILLLSQDGSEATTELVMDWILALGGDCVRLNGEDLNGHDGFALRFDRRGCELHFTLDGRRWTQQEIGVAWLRRWHRLENLGVDEAIADGELAPTVSAHLTRELAATFGALYAVLEEAPWLSRPGELQLNKLRALKHAATLGLDVPDTLITNDRDELEAFLERHSEVVCKPISDGCAFPSAAGTWVIYTAQLTRRELDRAPRHFFPTLAQELLAKAYELRVFYLDGECHAMAIFSQGDRQTQLDFRRYNQERPNRRVPYRLPEELAGRLGELMRGLGLTTGSLDLVRTVDGRFVFLEVNPVGQFGMVSKPCNYRLERRVAEYLLRKERDVGP